MTKLCKTLALIFGSSTLFRASSISTLERCLPACFIEIVMHLFFWENAIVSLLMPMMLTLIVNCPSVGGTTMSTSRLLFLDNISLWQEHWCWHHLLCLHQVQLENHSFFMILSCILWQLVIVIDDKLRGIMRLDA